MQDEIDAKIVIIGQTNVGKTCIVQKFIQGNFSEKSENTLAGTYLSKVVELDGYLIRLQIWDTAGQERYRSMARIYYRGAHAAILVYDINERSSFDAIDSWVDSLYTNTDKNIQLYIIGNKYDLSDRQISYEEGEAKAKYYDAVFMEVSAKTGYCIEELFDLISKALLDKKLSAASINRLV